MVKNINKNKQYLIEWGYKIVKILYFNNKQYQAEEIIKTDTDIIGLDSNKNQIFAFKDVSNFKQFTLEEGQTFDIIQPSIMDLQTQIFNLITQLVIGGVI